MLRKVIYYGVIAGLVVGSILFGITVATAGEPPLQYGMVVGYLSMLLALSAEMEKFRVQYSDRLFRMPMTFVEIFPVGVLVSLVSAGWLRTRRTRS